VVEGAKGGGTVATQGSPDLQKSTAKQKSAACITGVNRIAPNFVTLVATYIYRCHRTKGPNFGRVFLMLNYTDITQNTYIQS